MPMIYHPLRKLIEAEVKRILVVSGTEHLGDVVGLLGSGAEFGCELTYRVQDQAGGIAHALGLAREFAGGDPLVVVLGDNIFQDSLTGSVERFRKQGRGARLMLKEVPDPERFGVADLRDGRIVRIVEKPKEAPSRMCVTGIYFYDSRVFEIISSLRPSARGELEITDVNNVYVSRNELEYDVLEGFWSDAGTFESLYRANGFFWK
jgi:glucose-1-phosphate thymidylyltransferase